jgi:hypothetical protein
MKLTKRDDETWDDWLDRANAAELAAVRRREAREAALPPAPYETPDYPVGPAGQRCGYDY